jgi:alanine dehydrogenase
MAIKLRVLSAAQVRQALPMGEAIAGMKTAFAQLSSGTAIMPLRGRVDVAPHGGTALVMPAFLPDTDDLAVKVVSIFPQNAARQEPVVYAAVLVLDASSGRPLALMEGGTLTAIRTGAGSGAATDLLAQPDAAVVAIIGSGVQARTQLEAVCTVRRIREARVYSPNSAHAMAFAKEMQGVGPVPKLVRVTDDPEAAVRDADIICAATTANKPVFASACVKPGAHINGVGSFAPTMQEIDSETVKRALVVVDSREAAGAEAGDLIIPLQAGLIATDHVHAELGEIVAGRKPGRTNPGQVTFFKSVGVAVQDTAAARIALRNALKQDLGSTVTL